MVFNAISRPVCRGWNLQAVRGVTTQPSAFPIKYADRLQQKSEVSGISVRELLKNAEVVKEKQRKSDIEELKKASEKLKKQSGLAVDWTAQRKENRQSLARKDAPPYKDLSSILNLQRLFSTPHTTEQISALWTAYHASRSGGTGRGFVCASIPLALYEKMAKNGRNYPSFVVPVRRVQAPPSEGNQQENVPHEFYYLQWDFYPAPPIPSAVDDPFLKPTYTTSAGLSNPPISTILYAPLQEYKLRQAFATPYLVLTMYTDLAASHGIVLLRGEITPSTSSSSDSYMMSQEDAQLLTLALQRFYLWSEEGETAGKEFGRDGRNLLVAFHKTPQTFDWKDLLKFADPRTV